MLSTCKDQTSSYVAGFIYAGLAAALWSLIAPFSRALMALGLPPLEVGLWRVVFAALLFAIQGIVLGKLKTTLKDAFSMLIIGGLFGAMMFGGLQISIERSGGATAVVLLYTAPLWVAILARLLFNEAISRTKLLALFIAVVGVGMVSLSGGSLQQETSLLGIACGLLAGFGYAAFFPFTVWFGKKNSVETMYTYAFLGSTLFLLPLCWPLHADKTATMWGLLIAMTILTNYLAYLALAYSLKRITQVQSAIVGNIEPILGTFLVWLLFDENFTAIGWVGCALVLLAVFLLTLEKPQTPQPSA